MTHKKAMSPTISEFDGMRITIHPKEPQHRGEAHIHVRHSRGECSLTIPEFELLEGKVPSGGELKKLKGWANSFFPEKTKKGIWAQVEVSDRLLQDWLTIVNGQMPEKPATPEPIKFLIPTPQEIKNLKAPSKAKKSSFYDRAQIVKASIAKGKPFHLDVEFADGAKKRVDIKAMYENQPVHPSYKRHVKSEALFAQAHHDRWQVWWGDPGEESELEHTDLYSAGVNI